MMAMTMETGVLVGVMSLVLLLFWSSVLLRPSLRLPPGPRPLPILGNVLLLRKFASTADFANELKRQYGPIVTFWLFSKPVVVISEPELLREAMLAQGSAFMGRAQFRSMEILLHGFRSLAFGHGERHRFLRKMMVSEILSVKRMAAFRPIREAELGHLIRSLKRQQQLHPDGAVDDFRSLMRLTVCNLIVGILFGRRLTAEEYGALDAVLLHRFRLLAGRPRDFMPWLAWLPDRAAVRDQWQMRREIARILGPLIEERERQRRPSGQQSGQQAAELHATTYVDTLLELRDGKGASPVGGDIVDGDVELICIEVLSTGTDGTALNLEYCIANLINNPQIQEKLAQEIFAVAGEREVNEADIPHLPYLQAVVKEGLRRHSPARLAVPRRTLTATRLGGYDIPVDTLVQQHLEAVSLSPEIWEEPLEFRPERHLGKPLDITGSTKITMTPFGMGRRICPAKNIAFLHAQLVLARLIQAFEWKSLTPDQPLDLTPGPGFSNPMKYPLVTSIQERVNITGVSL